MHTSQVVEATCTKNREIFMSQNFGLLHFQPVLFSSNIQNRVLFSSNIQNRVLFLSNIQNRMSYFHLIYKTVSYFHLIYKTECLIFI